MPFGKFPALTAVCVFRCTGVRVRARECVRRSYAPFASEPKEERRNTSGEERGEESQRSVKQKRERGCSVVNEPRDTGRNGRIRAEG